MSFGKVLTVIFKSACAPFKGLPSAAFLSKCQAQSPGHPLSSGFYAHLLLLFSSSFGTKFPYHRDSGWGQQENGQGGHDQIKVC